MNESSHDNIDTRTAPYAAFVLRLALGSMFIAHGLLKLMVFTPAGTVKFFESNGLPGPLAYAVIAAELLGGAAITAEAWRTPPAMVMMRKSPLKPRDCKPSSNPRR